MSLKMSLWTLQGWNFFIPHVMHHKHHRSMQDTERMTKDA